MAALEVLRLAALGWRIFPCVARDKRPLLRRWQEQASSDADVISAWAQRYEACNWGMACGRNSGVWVLDIDGSSGEASFRSLIERNGANGTDTLTAITARGQHLYFAYPKCGTVRPSAGKLGDGLDVRGDGGFVIVPPSVHPSGAYYVWRDFQQSLAFAPAWLLDAVTAPSQRKPLAKDEIGILPEGRRNDGLTRLGGALRRKGKTHAVIEAELFAANLRRCRPPLPDHEVRKIAASVAQYAPGGLDPLERAWQAIQSELADLHSSNYDRFFRLAQALQIARPGQPIALPLERIAGLMRCHWTMVGRYRQRAVVSGALIPAGNYIPHRKAGTYLVSPVNLSSGLVRRGGTEPAERPSETSDHRLGSLLVRQSDAKCYVHGTHAEWWYRPEGDAVCNRCHPKPDSQNTCLNLSC